MDLIKFFRDAAARKFEALFTKSQRLPVGTVVQHTNPAKNAQRKAKAKVGARQFRKQIKATRRIATGASKPQARAFVAEQVEAGIPIPV